MKRLVIDTNVVLDALLPDGERPQGDRSSALLILEAVAGAMSLACYHPWCSANWCM
jgi:hypothetical protein